MIASSLFNVKLLGANGPGMPAPTLMEPMAFWANERPPEDNGDTDFRIRIQMEQLVAIQNQKNGNK